MHRRLVYNYLLNVPSFSSRFFNKMKRTSRLGKLLAISLEILKDVLMNFNNRFVLFVLFVHFSLFEETKCLKSVL